MEAPNTEAMRGEEREEREGGRIITFHGNTENWTGILWTTTCYWYGFGYSYERYVFYIYLIFCKLYMFNVFCR